MLPYLDQLNVLSAELLMLQNQAAAFRGQMANSTIRFSVDGKKMTFNVNETTQKGINLLLADLDEQINALTQKCANLPLEWLLNAVREKVDSVEPGLFNGINTSWDENESMPYTYISFKPALTRRGIALKNKSYRIGHHHPLQVLTELEAMIAELPKEDESEDEESVVAEVDILEDADALPF